MIKKMDIYRGIKGSHPIQKKQGHSHKYKASSDTPENITACLNCTKSASQCKGNCFIYGARKKV